MATTGNILKRLAGGRTEVLGIDFGTTGIKIVMLRKTGDGSFTVAAAALLPALEEDSTFELPKVFTARHAAIAVSDRAAVIKLLSLPGQHDESSVSAELINEQMGLDSAEYRIGFKVISQSRETRLLTVALPEGSATVALGPFAAGIPVPVSLEISGLSALTAFLHGPAKQYADGAVGVIEFGAEQTFLAFFNKGDLVLLRKFDMGSTSVCEKIQQALGVDADTAWGIMTDGSFDISQPISEVLDPFLRQLVISRDFIERRDQCHVSMIYGSSGLTGSAQGVKQFEAVTGVEAVKWDPFADFAPAPGAVPEQLQGQGSRFAAAIGAGLAWFEGR